MPLRKNGTILPLTGAVLAACALAVPSAASALSLSLPSVAVPSVSSGVQSTSIGSAFGSAASSAGSALGSMASAAGSTLNLTSKGCAAPSTTTAFQRFGDSAQYYVAPGGSFENGAAGWKFANGAQIVSGNESLGVAGGSKSLQLPVGGVALSPAFCVDVTQPSFRFTQRLSQIDSGYAAVVIYRDTEGKAQAAQFTSATAGSVYNGTPTWNVSSVAPLATKIPLIASSGKAASVQLAFVGTTIGHGNLIGATATIDSVMVDPYRRG